MMRRRESVVSCQRMPKGLAIGLLEVLIHVVLVRVYTWIASIPASRPH